MAPVVDTIAWKTCYPLRLGPPKTSFAGLFDVVSVIAAICFDAAVSVDVILSLEGVVIGCCGSGCCR